VLPLAVKKQSQQKRTRNAAATRGAILEAARIVFSREGYDRVGVREIAGEAGVTAALVNRYFGSKQGLFAEVMESKADLSPVFSSSRATFGQWFARDLVTRHEHRTKFDPMLVVLRSASDPEAGAIIRATLEQRLSKPLAAWLGGADSSQRAGLILAFVCGFYMMRNIIGTADLLRADVEQLVSLMAPVFQSYVDSVPPDPVGAKKRGIKKSVRQGS
jgi:AcrR family transcriptional regulator